GRPGRVAGTAGSWPQRLAEGTAAGAEPRAARGIPNRGLPAASGQTTAGSIQPYGGTAAWLRTGTLGRKSYQTCWRPKNWRNRRAAVERRPGGCYHNGGG